MRKKIGIAFGIIALTSVTFITIVLVMEKQKSNNENEKTETQRNESIIEKEEVINSSVGTEIEDILTSAEQLNIQDIDGKETNYIFTYKGQEYKAIYTTDNWHIENSYQIRNHNDMKIICEALINIHPIHGKDKVSYRTVDDLVYEWELHNIAYDLLPEENKWKSNVKHVDLNPEDQGKDLVEMYKSRI